MLNKYNITTRKLVQRRLNERFEARLMVDGIIGKRTLAAIKHLGTKSDEELLKRLGITIDEVSNAEGVDTLTLLRAISKRDRPTYPELAKYLDEAFNLFSTSDVEKVHFLSQCNAESGLNINAIESMRYSAKRVVTVFGKHHRDVVTNTAKYTYNGATLASYVYGNRLGNGGPETLDGFVYRGRPLIHITGKEWYDIITQVHNDLWLDEQIDYTTLPDLLLTPKHAARASVIWWMLNDVTSIIEGNSDYKDIVRRVTKRVQGGKSQLANRIVYFERGMRLIS